MEALVAEYTTRMVPADLAELADEMLEDPRCHLVVLGGDGIGAVLFSIWDDETVSEVAASLEARGLSRLRRLRVHDPRQARTP